MRRIKLHKLLLELYDNLVSVDQVKIFIQNNYRRRQYWTVTKKQLRKAGQVK